MPAQENDKSIFGLEVTPPVRAHLVEGANWGMFLAIAGMTLISLFVLSGISGFLLDGRLTPGPDMAESLGEATGYMMMAIVAYYAMFSLYKFCRLAKRAQRTNNQSALNEAFRHLKNLLKTLGIMTIIFAALFIGAVCVAVLRHK